MRTEARGPSAVLITSTPAAVSIFAASTAGAGSSPSGGLTSTETTNFPAAIFCASLLRSSMGTRRERWTGSISMTRAWAVSTRFQPLPPPIIRTAPRMLWMWFGVVPQQPPTARIPAFSMRRPNTPKYSGLPT